MTRVVIDIPEKELYKIEHDRVITDEQRALLFSSIIHGTVLPEGHGRLIDADEEIKYARKWIEHSNQYISQRNKDFIYYLEKAETVIPADKGE